MEQEFSKEKVFYRQAEKEDSPEMTEVYYTSLFDMARRMNFPDPRQDIALMQEFYRYAISTGIFYVATINKKIVGISGAIIRDHIWFLSAFWVLPAFQGKGIGFPIVKEVYEAGKKAGCTIFCVYSSSDYPAMTSYMKLGMLPGYPTFSFSGKPKFYRDTFIRRTMVKQDLTIETANSLDLKVRGVVREQDQKYFKKIGSIGIQVEIDSVNIGYYYFRDNFIGPVVSIESEYTDILITSAINDILSNNPDQSIAITIPGINHNALNLVLSFGLRIQSISYFLYSSNFGNLENYIPSGPGLY